MTCPNCVLCEKHQLWRRFENLLHSGETEYERAGVGSNYVSVDNEEWGGESLVEPLRNAIAYLEQRNATSHMRSWVTASSSATGLR